MAYEGMPLSFDTIILVLSGGNALGSYQAGACQALQEQGIEPDWVAAASAGAVNGAIICGNPPERRLARLQELWQPDLPGTVLDGAGDKARRTAAVAMALALGRPGLFTPRRLFGPFWEPFLNPEPGSFYDLTPFRGTLERLVDFELLNRGKPRFSAMAVDVESGEDVVFETGRHEITADHLRASSALMPAFSPVEVEGRLLADAGLSQNLPLDIVLSRPPAGRTLCIALDLLPLAGPRPQTLGDAMCRAQDLAFATQSRRAIAAWQAIFDRWAEAPLVTLLHVAYADQDNEVSGKAFDFSAPSARARWDAGYRDLGEALAWVRSAEADRPGLTIHSRNSGGFSGG